MKHERYKNADSPATSMTMVKLHKFVPLLLSCFIPLSLCQSVIYRSDLTETPYKEYAKQPIFNAVCYIQSSGGKTTGVLISKDTVLTVAHGLLDSCYSAVAFLGPSNEEITVKGKAVVHPDYRRVRNEKNVVQELSCDIAVLKLETPIENITPAPLELNASFTSLNQPTISVGFGKVGHGADRKQQRPASKQKLAFTGRVAQKKAFFSSGEVFDILNFHDPEDPAITELEGIGVDGDSGAPVFIYSPDGKLRVYAITVLLHGDGRYGSFNALLPLAPYREWIEKHL